MTTDNWLVLFLLLSGIIGYFLKRIMDNTDKIVGDVNDMKPKVDLLWVEIFSTSHSPRQLNPRGEDILKNSGIKEIVDTKKDKLLAAVKEKKPTNPYDAEMAIMQVMQELPKHCPDRKSVV